MSARLRTFQVFSKHLLRVNGDEFPDAASENSSLLVTNLSHIGVYSSAYAALVAFNDERLAEWDRLQVLDRHLLSQSDDVSQFVHLSHGFIEHGSDDTTVRVSGRPNVAVRKLDAADEGLACFIKREAQAHALGVVGAAAETMVLGNLDVPGAVTGVVLCHREAIKSQQRHPRAEHAS